MVYTVTLNPALDLSAPAAPASGGAARYGQGDFIAGGKGINVSRLLTSLWVENRALGFLGGFTGQEVERQLAAQGCKTDFLPLPAGCTRINLKLLGGDGGVTELNGDGPEIPLPFLEKLEEKCAALGPGDGLVLAGSVPPSLPRDVYVRLLGQAAEKGVLTVVDASGEALKAVLCRRPFLIKPNLQELEELFQVEIATVSQAAEYAGMLREMGAQNVVVSMGEKGALLADSTGRRLFCRAARGEAVSAVGAGDSLVAGFLYGWSLHGTGEGALRWGVAAGCATAFTAGIAQGDMVKKLYPLVGNPYPL